MIGLATTGVDSGLGEALTSAVFDELDGFGAEAGLPLILWKLSTKPDGLVVEGRINDDLGHSISSRWAEALGMTEVPFKAESGCRMWSYDKDLWHVVIIGDESS
jgi:hypothetical protein